jgi:hypothetical protein
MSALRGFTRRDMWLRYPTLSDVLGPCLVQARTAVRPAPDDGAVMIVLAVILPPALPTDFVVASFGQSSVAAAWAGVGNIAGWRKDVLQRGVAVEPLLPSADQFVIWHRGIVMRAA